MIGLKKSFHDEMLKAYNGVDFQQKHSSYICFLLERVAWNVGKKLNLLFGVNTF